MNFKIFWDYYEKCEIGLISFMILYVVCVYVGVEVDGLSVNEAYFRGRKLEGTTMPLPQGYSGWYSFFTNVNIELSLQSIINLDEVFAKIVHMLKFCGVCHGVFNCQKRTFRVPKFCYICNIFGS